MKNNVIIKDRLNKLVLLVSSLVDPISIFVAQFRLKPGLYYLLILRLDGFYEIGIWLKPNGVKIQSNWSPVTIDRFDKIIDRYELTVEFLEDLFHLIENEESETSSIRSKI